MTSNTTPNIDESLLLQQAEAGDANAQYNLAVLYSEGDKKLQKKAFVWAKKASKAGLPAGQGILAYFYEHGIGVRPSATKALDWLKKAAKAGDAKAQVTMGEHLLRSNLAEERQQGIDYLQQNIIQGNPHALHLMASLQNEGRGVEQDIDSAFHTLRRLHDEGYYTVNADLALFYIDGYPEGRDIKEAIRLLEEGIAQKKATALCHYLLADIYLQGYEGEVERNFELCRQHLKAAAQLAPNQFKQPVRTDLRYVDYYEENPEEC